MKLEIASVIALICCSLIVSTSAQTKPTCAQLQQWNIPYFQCQSGDECYFKWYECDSILDCTDFPDENHCQTEHTVNCEKDFLGKKTSNGEPLQSFQCDNGMCILGCQRCDGVMDCADNSDESGCSGTEVIPPCN
ncbi:very low-density lipoprotein receptor-like [Patiria miniata]|uniref:Uncharacterized protein n=1 Tax=Patiria miniata TaxID=46514 RepID=A0A914A6U2_PATMI|nr:very low-density lipoprotein receptor-like [Patiria miniata]